MMEPTPAKGKIRAVLFDLGDTLLNYGRLDPYKPFGEAARNSYAYLEGLGQPVGSYHLYFVRNIAAVQWRLVWSAITGRDFDSLKLLKDIGRRAGYALSDEQYDELVWLWYEPLSRLVTIEQDLAQTLAKLRQRGMSLGIVSNTFVHGRVLDRHIAQLGLTEYFDLVYYSYNFPRRKPHTMMFVAAAEALGFAPDQIVFVGDRLDTDMAGAIRAGMHPVLKKGRANERKAAPAEAVRIDTISELPAAIDRIEDHYRQGR